jgi:DNA-binding beta-propeller fold protein YncE
MLRCFTITLCTASTLLAQSPPNSCNQPMPEPVAHVALPIPFSAIPSSDGCWVFASVSSPNGVAVLKRAGGAITLLRIIPTGGSGWGTGGSVWGMVVTHDGRLIIAVGEGRIVFLDFARAISGQGDAMVGEMIYDRSAESVQVNVTADDRYLFVSDEKRRRITVIDLEKARRSSFSPAAVVGRIPVGVSPVALTFSPDNKFLYATSQSALRSSGWPSVCKAQGADPALSNFFTPEGAVHVVDVERAKSDPANAVLATVPAGCAPVRLALSPQGEFAYVTARHSDVLLVFDTRKLTIDPEHARVATVPVGVRPIGVDVADSGRLIFVANANDLLGGPGDKQSVTVIDASRVSEGAGAVLGTVPAGAFPREVHVTTDGRTVLVTNHNSNTLQLIDVKRKPWRPQ